MEQPYYSPIYYYTTILYSIYILPHVLILILAFIMNIINIDHTVSSINHSQHTYNPSGAANEIKRDCRHCIDKPHGKTKCIKGAYQIFILQYQNLQKIKLYSAANNYTASYWVPGNALNNLLKRKRSIGPKFSSCGSTNKSSEVVGGLYTSFLNMPKNWTENTFYSKWLM